MKFILILHVCSLLNQACPGSMYPREIYPSHYDCAIAGYTQARELFEKLPKDVVNQQKLAIKFECRELQSS